MYDTVLILPSTYLTPIMRPLASNSSPATYSVFGYVSIIIRSISLSSMSIGPTGLLFDTSTLKYVLCPLYVISTSQFVAIMSLSN